MKHMLYILALLALTASFSLPLPVFSTAAQAAIALPNLIKTCLPEAGRMKRGAGESCHCPPQSMCPEDGDEWAENNGDGIAGLMPPRQAAICCDPPARCNVQFTTMQQAPACTVSSFSESELTFCREYEAIPVVAETSEDEDEQEALNEAAEEENERRSAAADDATSCARRCVDRYGASDQMSSGGWADMQSCFAACRPGTPAESSCTRDITYVRCDSLICQQERGGGGGEGGDCLAPDTEVVMADGSVKALSLLKEGDLVKGHQSVNTVQKVLSQHWDEVTLYSINGGLLNITEEHPLLTAEGWKAINYNDEAEKFYGLKEVGKLQPGDVLITHGSSVVVETIEAGDVRKDYTTYNLRLDGTKSFYAAGALVKSN
jgi:hypothetical protein